MPGELPPRVSRLCLCTRKPVLECVAFSRKRIYNVHEEETIMRTILDFATYLCYE